MLKNFLIFFIFCSMLTVNNLIAKEQVPKIQSKFVTGECKKLINDMWLINNPKFDGYNIIEAYEYYLLSNKYLNFLLKNIHSGFNAKVELYDNYEKGRTRIETYTWISDDELIIQFYAPIGKTNHEYCDIYRFKKEGDDVLVEHYTSRNLPD